ncbi:MAG: glutaredoxin family protein [Nitrospirae bacterium]|nr:MAG: glutaredoxin family protein [Nitrospirota bacterium]
MADEKKVVLFALSTCPACKKTKALLKELGVDAVVVDLDTVDRESRDKLLEEVRKFNPRETFPTLVINGGEKVVVGFSESEIRQSF